MMILFKSYNITLLLLNLLYFFWWHKCKKESNVLNILNKNLTKEKPFI